MAKLDEACREVINKAEWVAIATAAADGPHLVATWGDYVRKLGIEGDRILIPAGHFHKTEENLRRDARVELLFATRQVQGTYGPGRGCNIVGTAELQTSGPAMDAAKAHFPWARGVLVVTVKEAQLQL